MVEGPRDAALGVSAPSAGFCCVLTGGAGVNIGIGMGVGLMVLEHKILGLGSAVHGVFSITGSLHFSAAVFVKSLGSWFRVVEAARA